MDAWTYITVKAELRSATCLGMTVYTGKKLKLIDSKSGKEFGADRHHWLSRRFAVVEKAWVGPHGERMVELRMPEWLAKHEGIQ